MAVWLRERSSYLGKCMLAVGVVVEWGAGAAPDNGWNTTVPACSSRPPSAMGSCSRSCVGRLSVEPSPTATLVTSYLLGLSLHELIVCYFVCINVNGCAACLFLSTPNKRKRKYSFIILVTSIELRRVDSSIVILFFSSPANRIYRLL